MAMEKAEFEKRFLALVHRSEIVITAPNIAYHLSIPIDEAQDRLLDLELNGTLQQAASPRGDTYYVMPHRPMPGTMRVTATPVTPGAASVIPGVYNPAALPAMAVCSGAKGVNINGLVLNVIVPGAGSLVCGKAIGVAMLAVALLGILLMFLPLGFGRLVGLLPLFVAYLWSIVAGVQLLNRKEPGPGIPS
jgi:hypothetical protein